MRRYARGDSLPKEVKYLGASLWELRVQVSGTALRLHFAPPNAAAGPVALALQLVDKKTQKARDHGIGLSRKRLADWERRNASPGPATVAAKME